jgi:hypothetical protein
MLVDDRNEDLRASPAPEPMPGVKIALAAGLVIAAAALGVVLSGMPLSAAASNGVPARSSVAFTPTQSHDRNCGPGGTLPTGTQAIRVSLSANVGPRVAVEALSGPTVVTEGARDAGWGIDETVTVPVTRVPQTIHRARICTTVGRSVEPIQINGASVRVAGGAPEIALRMEYLRPGQSSWLSLAPSVARRMGIAHAPSGTFVAYLVIATMIAVSAVASRLVLRELG